MTLVQFIAALIKALSDFQNDWKELRKDPSISVIREKTFADWLAIFEKYALRVENEKNGPF